MSRISRFLFSLRGGQLQRDLDDEVEFHIDMKTRELVALGVPESDARARARRQFGNVAAIEDRTRDVDRLPSLDSLSRDLRFSIRGLRKSPTFTAVAVATIALGIGANLAVFGMVEALLLRPLPFHDARNLMMLGTRDGKGQLNWASYADIADWRAQSATLEHLSAYTAQSVNLTGEREPVRLNGGFVSADFFTLLGVRPLRGRLFEQRDDEPSAGAVVVLSYRLWQARYGGAEDFVGRKMILNGVPMTVAGVLPPDFKFPWSDSDVWIPFIFYPNYRPNARAELNAAAFAHIREGHTREQAQAELTTIAARLASQFPDTNRDRGATVQPFQEMVVRDLRSPLLILWGAVGLVFLIACANLGNLALSRMLSREHELRVRMALGAGRGALLFQVVLENLLVAAAGFGLAAILGAAALRWLALDTLDLLPAGTRLGLDPPTLGYGVALALFSVLLCSSLAAAQVWKRRRNASPDGGRGLTESRERGFTRRALVVAEFALSIVLLAGAGLLLKSYTKLAAIDPGFRPDGLLTAEYRVPRTRYPKPEQQWAVHESIVRQLRQIPGVRSASSIFAMPFSGNGMTGVIVLPDRPAAAKGAEPRAVINRTAPGAFETLGIPLERGRYLGESDHAQGAKVAVISRTFAQRFWPDQDPVGRLVKLPEVDNPFTIVGIVGDIRQWQLDEPVRPQMYVPMAQFPHIFSTLMIRTDGDPAQYASALRQAVWAVDKDQPVWKVRTLQSMTGGFLAVRGFLPRVLGGFAAFALLLAAVGIYGVIAYSTARRIREFGLRMAIGAQPRDVVWLVLRDGLRMTLAGTVIGAAVALWLSRALKTQLQGQLFRVEPTDPATFAAVVVLLALVSLAACYIPARRALRVDPVTALRHE